MINRFELGHKQTNENPALRYIFTYETSLMTRGPHRKLRVSYGAPERDQTR